MAYTAKSYFRSILSLMFQNGWAKAGDRMVTVIATLIAAALALLLGGGIVFNLEQLRALPTILGFVVWLLLFLLVHYVKAQLQMHKRAVALIEALKEQRENYARLQAAHTLLKASMRIVQALEQIDVGEYPLKDAEFKKKYVEYRQLMSDSFITPPRHELFALPEEAEAGNKNRKDVELAIMAHRTLLNDYAAKLTEQDCSVIAMISQIDHSLPVTPACIAGVTRRV